MKKQTREQVLNWMYDRIEQGIRNEEVGSCDSLDDTEGFTWHCTVGENDGFKAVFFTTCINMFPFAIGHLTKDGKPSIRWD